MPKNIDDFPEKWPQKYRIDIPQMELSNRRIWPRRAEKLAALGGELFYANLQINVKP